MADDNSTLSPDQILAAEKELLRVSRERAKIEREINDAREAGNSASKKLLATREQLVEQENNLNDALKESTEAAGEFDEALDKLNASLTAAMAVIPGFVKGIDSAYGTGFSQLSDGIGSALSAILAFNNETA